MATQKIYEYMKSLEQYITDTEYLPILYTPQKTIYVSVPFKKDDGLIEILQGYRIQHNNARGPFKGGIRFHPGVDREEVSMLALWMSIKTAVINIPYGGAKGGITVDPNVLSKNEIERMTRSFVRVLSNDIGPSIDIPAPDMYTNADIMDTIVDEYAKCIGKEELGVVTGKSVKRGGLKSRDSATGQGGFYVLQTWLSNLHTKYKTIAVQGIGNVGSHFAKIASKEGYIIVALSDSKTAIYKADGLDVQAVLAYKKQNRSLLNYPDAQLITNEELLSLEVDILAPSALSNQINISNANEIKAKLILELANGPISLDAESILLDNNINIIPDVLANSGGVLSSYYEWFQNVYNENWGDTETRDKMRKKMIEETLYIWNKKQKLNLDARQTAYVVAMQRIVDALKQKEI